MSRRIAWLPLLLLGLATPAHAEVKAGAECTLATKVKMSARKRGKGKKTRLEKGDQIVIVKPGSSWTRVKRGPKKGYIKTSVLESFCAWIVDDGPETPEPIPVEARADPAEPVDALTAAPGPPGEDALPLSTGDEAFGKTYKIKIAVMDLAGANDLHPDLIASLTSVVPETLDELGIFKSISTQEIRQMLVFESQKQLLGCNEAGCLAEIGGALGADFMVTGNISGVSGPFMIQLQLTNVNESRVESRTSREYEGDSQGLYDQLRAATKILVRDLLGERSGTATVRVSEEGASIKIDGTIVGVSPLVEPVSVAGGMHALVVEKEGFVVARQDINIVKDRNLDIDIRLLPSADFIAAYEEQAGLTRTMAWLAISVGVVGLGGSGALYYVGMQRADYLNEQSNAYNGLQDRPNERYERLDRLEQELATIDLATTISASVGLVAIGVGAILFATGDDPDRYEAVKSVRTPASSFGVSVGPSGAMISGSF